MIIHVDAWLLAGATVGGFSFLVWCVYKLLMYASKLTIQGVHDKMDRCRSDLEIKIDSVHNCANNCCDRVGRLESTLNSHGVKSLGIGGK